ncbi:MAG: signal peptidase II [Anaerolineaceae bacterium]|nr:signal peptidase II [Anaerolineaceae bacterium]
MKLVKKYFFLFGIAGAIIALDQVTKNLVKTNLASGESWLPWSWLGNFARIVNWHNTGAAFGLFQNGNTVFTILAVVVAIVIIFYYPQVPQKEKLMRVAMAMQLGGAVGNLIDRITQGFVTDFISIGNFPVFNVADSSITIGVGVLLLGMWLEERRTKLKTKNEEDYRDSIMQDTNLENKS